MNDKQNTQDSTESYNGYSISDLGYGFRPFDNRLGLVTSFVVSKPDFVCVFAFAINGMEMIAHGGSNDDLPETVQKAVDVVKSNIDSDNLENRHEYTFEYNFSTGEFDGSPDAGWWIKSSR